MQLSHLILAFAAVSTLSAAVPQQSTVTDRSSTTAGLDFPCDPRPAVVPYGDGWSGTLGVPDIGGPLPSAFGGNFNLEIGNSSPTATKGCLMIATDNGDAPTAYGGNLLVDVDRIFSLVAIQIPAGGYTHPLPIPVVTSETCGLTVFMQVVMVDTGATHNVAFTRGLRVTLGAEQEPVEAPNDPQLTPTKSRANLEATTR